MLDTEQIQQQRRQFADCHTKDQPNTLNSFDGEFAITDHELIPTPLRQFLMLSYGTGRLNRVSIEDINSTLNSVWQGPGSLSRIFELEQILMNSSVNFSQGDLPRKTARRADK